MNNIEYGKIYATYMFNKVLKNISPRMTVKRKKKYGQIKIMSPELKCNSLDITPYLNHGEYNDIIKQFLKIFEEELPHCSKTKFYTNIKSLNIKEKVLIDEINEKNVEVSGTYFHNNMNIKLTKGIKAVEERIKKEKKWATNHELLHLASKIHKGIITFFGFNQIIGIESFGYGLNEGYTELLNERYFSKENQYDAYFFQQPIALGIEEVVGKEKMETLYFDANLDGLIEELCKYTTKNEVLDLISKTDVCHIYERTNKKMHLKLAGELRTQIANLQNIKNRKLLNDGKITQEEFEDRQLKIAFYVRNFSLEQNDEGCIFKSFGNKYELKLSQAGYEMLKKHFFSMDEAKRPYLPEDAANEEIICYAMVIEKTDLQQVETIEMTTESNKYRYKVIPKENNIHSNPQTQSELNAMFEDQNINNKSSESKKTPAKT